MRWVVGSWAETDKALLIVYDGTEYWIPRSQIEDRGEHLARGDRDVTVSITGYIANEKGIG
jgi:hypothetical protein